MSDGQGPCDGSMPDACSTGSDVDGTALHVCIEPGIGHGRVDGGGAGGSSCAL